MIYYEVSAKKGGDTMSEIAQIIATPTGSTIAISVEARNWYRLLNK